VRKEIVLVRKTNLWSVREVEILFIIFLGVKLSLLYIRDTIAMYQGM
jgi:hypothetical protein